MFVLVLVGLIEVFVLPLVLYLLLKMPEPTWLDLEYEEPPAQMDWWRLLLAGLVAFLIGCVAVGWYELRMEYSVRDGSVPHWVWNRLVWRLVTSMGVAVVLVVWPAAAAMYRAYHGKTRVWCVLVPAVLLPFVHVATIFPAREADPWQEQQDQWTGRRLPAEG